MQFRSAQLMITDPFRQPGWDGQGVINRIKQGEWVVYTKREKSVYGNTAVHISLLHIEAARHLQDNNGNLRMLEGVYGGIYQQEPFEVTIDRRLIAFVDFGTYVNSREGLSTRHMVEVLQSGNESVPYKSTRNSEIGGSFVCGRIVNTVRDDGIASLATLRNEQKEAVSIFMVLRDYQK